MFFKAVEIGLGATACLPMWAEEVSPERIDFVPITGCSERGSVSLVTRHDLYCTEEIDQMIARLYERFHANEKCLHESLKQRGLP